MNLLFGVFNAAVSVIIYILLVKYANGDNTPESYRKGAELTKSLEMFIFISVFLSFFVNNLLF